MTVAVPFIGMADVQPSALFADAMVIQRTPTVIGEKHDGSNPNDKRLDEYADISRKVAKGTNSQMLDLREKFLAYLKEHNTENAEKGILTGDTVHLNKHGNAFLSQLVLNAFNVPNAK